MSTSIDIINDAMFSIGASSDINAASPELINASFRRFKQWLIFLTTEEIKLAEDAEGNPILLDVSNLPTDPAAELGNAPYSDLSLSAGLAPWIAPLFRIKIMPGDPARGAADVAMRYLYALSLKATLPEWPETLPVGGGNSRGPKGRVFFPVPEVSFEREDDGSVTT